MIPVQKVRELTLKHSGGDEHSKHISAASALVRVESTLYVLADDEFQMGVWPAEGAEDGYLMSIMDGELPTDERERAQRKPDFECMALMAPFAQFTDGAILALGSGSGDERNRGSLIPLKEEGTPTGDFQVVELGTLYERLRTKLGELDIEGAAVVGDTLLLLQRGGDDGRNARIDLDLQQVHDALARGEALPPSSVGQVENYDLGQLRGVKLCFSDASPLPDGRMAFIASAETSAGGVDKYVGSAVGIMDAEGAIVMSEPVDHEVKLEGLSARVRDDDRLEILMVSDADDPSMPSSLLQAELEV